MKKIIDNFQLIFDSREKIQELRNLILNLAVRGKLVPQNPADEPASILIEKIKKEKERLIKEKKIRKAKPLPPIKENEIPFEIPESWEWVRLNNVSLIIMGQSPNGKTVGEDIDGIEFHQGKSYFGKKYLNYSNIYTNSPKKIARKDNVLLSVRAPVGKLNITNRDICIGRGLCAISGLGNISKKFFFYFITGLEKYFHEKATGTTFKAITSKVVREMLIPLPPLNEQKSIVNKLDELMTFCDQLEVSLEKKANAKQLVSKSISNRIQKSKSKEEFDNNITFIIRNFKKVYTTPENVNDLKDIIIQLAIQGKLVPQDPDDEPASVLIEKINKEKERLIKEKKIRKTKPLPRIKEAEIPFELPKGWEWVRLGDVTTYGEKRTVNPENISDNEWVLELEDIEKESSLILKRVINKDRKVKSNKNRFFKNDVLYGKLRPYLKKVIVADSDGVCSTEIIPFNGYGFIFSSYIKYYLKSPFVDETVNHLTHGMSMPRLGTKNARKLVFPLPPLNEQKQIVQKIDKLMFLFNLLENQINKNRNNSELLMKSLLRKLFE